MSVFYIGKLTSLNNEFTQVFSNEKYIFAHTELNGKNFVQQESNQFKFCSDYMLVQNAQNKKIKGEWSQFESHDNLLNQLENETLSLWLTFGKNDFEISLASVKLSRARWYYITCASGVFFSSDMRQLLPYSQKKINRQVAFSILKFGETPEGETVISDIYSVPVSSKLCFNSSELTFFNMEAPIQNTHFQQYYKIPYSFSGGNISNTKTTLQDVLGPMEGSNTHLLISGGIDSTLLNCLFDEISLTSYPAHYISFSQNDKEIPFAQEAIKETKAELHFHEMNGSDLIKSFHSACTKMIYPTIDASSAFVGAFLSSKIEGPDILIDGTGADSCYGTRDYSVPLFQGVDKGSLTLKLAEYAATFNDFFNPKSNKSFLPRDQYIKDQNFQEVLWYLGAYANLGLKNSKPYTETLIPKLQELYRLIPSEHSGDSWAKYTVVKLALYACRQTSVKFYDMFPDSTIELPFLHRSMLTDQGKYSWSEKSINGIPKYPLKKILEDYKSKDFIYRKKVGLNNPIYHWFQNKEIKNYFVSIVEKGEFINMLTPLGRFLWRNNVKKDIVDPKIIYLTLSLASFEEWSKFNKVSL
ncbi:MAG: asparagine synthase-related protein [Reichenbachiella sp.]|uniref:asparagine synthase-related protein n=1 Tax=Reichenbachiella sp. TaxID=2184521 RepID=UPI003296D73C